jgi:hypothetical protein
LLPGNQPSGITTTQTGWLPLNGELRTLGSSNAARLEGRFAVDDDLRTWWQPDVKDDEPTLTSAFMAPATIHAARVIWRDVNLDTTRGVFPGPIRYRVDIETGTDQWTTIIDRSESNEDLLIDYRECKPIQGSRARLTVVEWPEGITPSVVEFTVFGQTVNSLP